jgi:hypothetical protein
MDFLFGMDAPHAGRMGSVHPAKPEAAEWLGVTATAWVGPARLGEALADSYFVLVCCACV